MALLSITRLRVRSWRFLPGFLWYAVRSARQAQRSQGYLGGKTYGDARLTFWTASAWQDEAAMKAYRSAEPHLRAMRKLAHWCDEASVAHWTTDRVILPSLEEVYRLMRERGRPSRVENPSPEHQAMAMDPPVARGERTWAPRAGK
jgi:quinol monooxygenase YgiN